MKKKYNEYTDEELIALYRRGDGQIMEFLMEKYKYLVRKKAKSLFILGGDDQDLIQEGMIGLYKAVRDYEPDKDASFSTFAELCVSRNMYTAVQKSKRKKHMPLNYYFSLSDPGTEDRKKKGTGGEEGHVQPLEHLAENDRNNPENIMLDKEGLDALELFIEESLTANERQAIELYIADMSIAEISSILGKKEKAIDNALQRAKTKIRKFLDSRDES